MCGVWLLFVFFWDRLCLVGGKFFIDVEDLVSYELRCFVC